jgi:UDP-glucose 4-epimerase
MKVLVTGGRGFLGSHVADALSDAGHEVVIFDIEHSPYLRSDQTEIIGSVLDKEVLDRAAAGCDAIFHFAAIADIDVASRSPVRTVEVNILGTTKVLEAACNAQVQRFVLASSIYVYSAQGSFYRTSKQACERLVEDYRQCFGLPFTILRFGSLYGPRADMSNTIYRMMTQALRESRIEYEGSGGEVREYIHVRDGATAAVRILAPEFENEIVHLTGHERMTTRNMIEMINEILGGRLQIKLDAGAMTGHYIFTPYSYMPKIGRKLIQQTYVDLGLGLLDLLQEIDSNTNADLHDWGHT